MQRTVFILVVVSYLVTNFAVRGSEPDASSDDSSIVWSAAETKQAREMARQKKRRLIYNDDGEEMAHAGGDTPEGFLEVRIKALAGTQVDTIAWSILGNWGDAPSYDSQVQPIHGDASGGPPPGHLPYARHLKAMIRAGNCPLRIVTNFAHENDMELLASMRMNDVHDSFVRGLITTWKRQHPEFLIDTSEMLPDKKLYTTAQDYSHQAVRDRKVEIIEEVCERYEVDGFELDYFRQPVYFSETVRGEPVTQQQVEIMTTFMRRVRRLTEKSGARRRRPFLIAARIPDTFQHARYIGLDVKTWLEEDLIDILIIGGGYAPFTLSVAETAELCHRYGVPVYPCLNQIPPGYTVLTEEAKLANRGLAANWYSQGADGIYFWNLGVPLTYPKRTGSDLVNTRKQCYVVLHEMGDPHLLATKDKIFGTDGPVAHHYTHASGEPPVPKKLQPDKNARVTFSVGDDLKQTPESLAKLTLAIDFEGVVNDDSLALALNSKRLTRGEVLHAKGNTTVTYSPDVSHVQQGINTLDVSLTGGSEPVELASVQLHVSRPATDVDRPMKIITAPTVQTDRLGGVDVPAAEVLKKMHAGQYILHAHDGELTRVPVEKVLLPHDPDAHPQAIQLVQGADGTLYAYLASIICKSTDGGRKWTSHKKGPDGSGLFEVLDDGSFILMGSEGEDPDVRVVFRQSRDEGRTWQDLYELPNPPGHNGGSAWIMRRKDGSLLAGIGHGNYVWEVLDGKHELKSGSGGTWSYLSKDKGRTWTRLSLIHDWASEGGVAQTPSGKLVGAFRYQRPTMPGDPPDLEKRNGSISAGWPWKNVFVVDSDDQGHTWNNFRQLTTVFGQTRGFPVALSDGTVVVIHDTRYGPGSPGSRAMISRDEGKTWQDEVYYLDVTRFTGSYNGSVVLDDDLILSVVGSSQAGNAWEKVKDNTDFYAIRWKP